MTLKASIVFLQQDECLFNKGAFYHTEHTNWLMNHKTANWLSENCVQMDCWGVQMESKSSRERNCSEMEAILVDGLLSLSASEMNAVWCF